MSAERRWPRPAGLTGLALRAENVTAGYGGDPVIRGITVAADPAEIISLVGPNGSGKSTLLKSLVGIVRVPAGPGPGRRRRPDQPRARGGRQGRGRLRARRSTTCSRR